MKTNTNYATSIATYDTDAEKLIYTLMIDRCDDMPGRKLNVMLNVTLLCIYITAITSIIAERHVKCKAY